MPGIPIRLVFNLNPLLKYLGILSIKVYQNWPYHQVLKFKQYIQYCIVYAIYVKLYNYFAFRYSVWCQYGNIKTNFSPTIRYSSYIYIVSTIILMIVFLVMRTLQMSLIVPRVVHELSIRNFRNKTRAIHFYFLRSFFNIDNNCIGD